MQIGKEINYPGAFGKPPVLDNPDIRQFVYNVLKALEDAGLQNEAEEIFNFNCMQPSEKSMRMLAEDFVEIIR